MSEAIRTLHVGIGARGRAYLTAPALTPVGLVDGDLEALAAGRQVSGLHAEDCFEDLASALEAVDADAAIVTAPPGERTDLCVQAMAADLHVLVQAPMAADPDEARRLVVIAQNRGVRLMVADSKPENVLAEQFAAYVLAGEEPPTSGRRAARQLELAERE